MTETLDRLELELRLIPGVMGVGLDDRSQLVIRLLLDPVAGQRAVEIRRRAQQLARVLADKPTVVSVEVPPPG